MNLVAIRTHIWRKLPENEANGLQEWLEVRGRHNRNEEGREGPGPEGSYMFHTS